MLTATLGVVAALAFVLGLGALCIWALKKWGRMSLTSRTRVAVEVVQRITLGPKTGLAVIRVGEKVMAVSIGDGGVRPLFELDEADRQRVIASSQIAMPMASSTEAAASFAKFLPGAFGKTLEQAMVASMPTSMPTETQAPAVSQQTSRAVFAPNELCEIPSFLTAPFTTQRGQPVSYGPPAPRTLVASDRDFPAMLGGALSGATRLAVFAGMMLLGSVGSRP